MALARALFGPACVLYVDDAALVGGHGAIVEVGGRVLLLVAREIRGALAARTVAYLVAVRWLELRGVELEERERAATLMAREVLSRAGQPPTSAIRRSAG